jgi:response regulator RpfG family c-di-GMP phosphodiesterase
MTTKKTVLIVDDSRLICVILEQRLRENGFDVVICHDGECGVKTAQEKSPDIIILDLILPQLPGEEVCRLLKRNPKTENIPVIMLTAKNNEVDKVIGRVLGANAYISKPFNMEELLVKLKDLLLLGIFLFMLVIPGHPCLAQEESDQKVPPGMELLKVGKTEILIPQGTKVTDKGSQLVLEPPEQFWSRRVKDMEEEIARLKDEQEKIKRDIEEIRQYYNQSVNGPKN